MVHFSKKKSLGTLSLLKDLIHYLSYKRKLQLLLLGIIMFLNGAAELASLGAIFPFLAALTNPEWLSNQKIIITFSKIVGITNEFQLLLSVTIIFACVSALAVCIRLINLWLNLSLASLIGIDLSKKAFEATLCQPYSAHIKLNAGSLTAALTNNISRTIDAVKYLLQFIMASIVAAQLLIGLIVINASLATFSFVLFGGVYIALAYFSKKTLVRNSGKIHSSSELRLQLLKESFSGIRDVILDNNQRFYINKFSRQDREYRMPEATNQFLSIFPRYILEGVVLVTMSLIAFVTVIGSNSGLSVVPLLGAFALGAQRILPSLQQLYGSWSSLKGYRSDILVILDLISKPYVNNCDFESPYNLKKSIKLSSVSFQYDQNQPYTLNDINLEIFSGERVGIVGTTGSGKSTTVDLLMGLLEPSEGKVIVDGIDINNRNNLKFLNAWRRSIAHVPQNIYLHNSTIAENIAFGIDKEMIDLNRVKRVAEQANLSEVIESRNNHYHSYVGEGGIKLSGGQKQRIGIARALYKNANILIFDEATSALDDQTESIIIDTIKNLSRTLTIIIIAHRPKSIEICDRIIRLEGGKIANQGFTST
jgi:ABC-type multidrug transport system fused ATPase/permease subunit